MIPKRRSFLQMAGLAPAAAAGLVTANAAQAAASPSSLTRSAFAACVGDEFAFELDAFKARAARLASVNALPGARDAETSFSLVFEVPAGGEGIAQETYRVSHARLGRLTLFVSPNDADGRIVEAVFNRL